MSDTPVEPQNLSQFAEWIRGQRDKLRDQADEPIGGSGKIVLPVAKSIHDAGPSEVTVSMQATSPRFVVKAQFLNLLDKLCPLAVVNSLYQQHSLDESSTVRELLLMMRNCEEQIRRPAAEDDPPGKQEKPKGTARTDDMTDAIRRAYLGFKDAEHHAEDPLTDREAYDWLDAEGPTEYDPLPTFTTWSRSLRKARQLLGEQKHKPRAGRTGRSVVRWDELETPESDES